MAKHTLKYADITEKIIGCAMRVHGKLHNGYQEVVYQRSLEAEFHKAGLEFIRECEMPIYYDDELIVGTRRVDFLVEGKISVELKAVSALEDVHLAQAINYLEAFQLEVGLLINFGSRSLQWKRLINQCKLNRDKRSPEKANATQQNPG